VTQPLKPFASIDEQIDVLASRGLVLDQAVAEQWLQSVGYYRLSG
jgi:abortive infection bacteriophage resistance protein